MPLTDVRWQNRMAPLMAGAVVVTAVFFAIVMLVRFSSIEATLQEPPPAQLTVPWTRQGIEPTTWRDQQQLASTEANFGLERELIARRYRVASAVMSLRLWTRLMGFLTGMFLAMVGAAFILGKLDAPESEVVGGASGATLSVKSASPGIVLAVLGTILIGISLVMPVTANVRDAAVYFGRTDPAAAEDDTAPTEAADPAKVGDIKLRTPTNSGAPE